MDYISLFSLVLLVTNVWAQTTSTVISVTATSTAYDYATGNVTYNTNDTPSPISTVFTYAVSGVTITRSETIPSTGVFTAGNITVTVQPSPTVTDDTAYSSITSIATSTASQAINTAPCNGYPEFCNRRYSNITHVAAHNSPFVMRNNVASNQALNVTYQLDDGVRMLQFQVHKSNDSLYLCHTSCDLLNAGTLVSYLTTVREWLDNNEYEVVTILMGNYDTLDPSEFVQPVVDSGLINYVYVPPTVPMALDGWPTLGEMILGNTRAVVMLDYEANQSEIPWLLDEFSYMWETPYSPTDPSFPCTAQRPPDKARSVYEERMNMANHNLNINVTLLGINILLPASNLLNSTNADSGYGSAAWAVQNCTRDWNRPPTFLLVDYYNIGNYNGSVFAVAAAANNVTYNRDSCCGLESSSAGNRFDTPPAVYLVVAVLAASLMMI